MIQFPDGIKDPHLEIKEKVDFWHTRMNAQLSRFNAYADFWRLVKPPRPGDLSGFANPQVTETTRATEAIGTFLYRAMTSAQPNYQLVSRNPYVPAELLWKNEQVLYWQQNVTLYRRKLLKACRSVALFGTVPVEQPWMMNLPYWESTDFIPRSLLQVAFDPLAFDIASSGWHALIDYVTEDQLRQLAIKNPDVWDREAIESAIDASQDMKNLSPEVTARMTSAGYQTYSGGHGPSHIYQLVTYYGYLKDDKNGTEYCVGTVNDLATVKFFQSPYGRRPLTFGHLNEFEMEPYAYGVGRVAEASQPDINSNRGRMHDTITFSLFNQWLADRAANLKPSEMKIKPWGVVEVDGNPENMLKAFRPQLEGVNFGIQLETLMKSEFRSTTGATDNLQAMVTEATATESSIAQTEAIRRLSVIAEILSEALLRDHVSKMQENNATFLDKPFVVGVSGESEPVRVFPSEFIPEVEVVTKIVTDKDFRPQRNKDLLTFLQVVTSIRSQNPQLGQVNLKPFVEEFARGVGMNPKMVWSAMPSLVNPQTGNVNIPNAIDQAGASVAGAEGVREIAGELGANARSAAEAGMAEVA